MEEKKPVDEMEEIPLQEELPQERPEKRKSTSYNAELHPIVIESLLQNGMTLKQVTDKLGIDLYTLNKWRKKYPEINTAIRNGRAPIDQKVISSLYRSAMGYSFEETVMEPKELTTREIQERSKMLNPPPIPLVKKKVTIKHVAPNVVAQIFYLKNRLPNDWKDRNNLDLSGKIEYEVTLPPRPNELKQVGNKRVKETLRKLKPRAKPPKELDNLAINNLIEDRREEDDQESLS